MEGDGMTRFEDWDQRLDAFLKTVGPFEWGVNDCCLFVGHAVREMTGEDVTTEYKGYKTAKGALKYIKNGVDGVATKHFGESKSPKLAKRGDVVMLEVEGEEALGICIGQKAVALTQAGLDFYNMDLARKAWTI